MQCVLSVVLAVNLLLSPLAAVANEVAFDCEPVTLDIEGGAAQLHLARAEAKDASSTFPWSISIVAADGDESSLSTRSPGRTVFQTLANSGEDGFLALASGHFGGASHNGNFNITGWEPSAATSIQTVSSCGHNASALWMSGALLSPQGAADLSAAYNFTIRASDGAAHWTVALNASGRMDTVTTGTDNGIGNVSRSLLRFAVHDGSSGCYGAGEQYTDVDLRGSFVPIITTEQGVGRDAAMFPGTLQSVSYSPTQQLLWLTEFLNSFGSGAGGSRQTTYTSIPTFLCPNNAVAFSLPDSSRVVSFDFRAQRVYHTTTAKRDHDQPHSNGSRVEVQILLADAAWSAWVFWNSSAPGGRWLSKNGSFPSRPNGSATPPLQVLSSLTNLLGRLPAPPLWVDSGAIVALEGGTEAVVSNLQSLLDWGVPVSGVWIQDWSGKRVDPFGSRLWWNWELDEELYNNWTGLVNFCRDNGDIKLLAYLNPYLASSGRTHLFDLAKAAGHLLLDATSPESSSPLVVSSGSDNFTFGTVDLSSPQARDWFVEKIMVKNVLSRGFSGWMADFGEYIPLSGVARSRNASTTKTVRPNAADANFGLGLHNEFPGLWALTNAAVRDRVDELANAAAPDVVGHASQSSSALARESLVAVQNGSDLLYFARSASLGSSLSHASVFWAGDQLVSWDMFDGLQSCLRGYLSGGFSGMTLMSSDIGGYTMQQYSARAGTLPSPPFPPDAAVNFTRSSLLLARWAEFAAFADVIFRSHVGNMPETSAQVYSGATEAKQFAFSSRVHSALASYRRELIAEARQYGWPVVRHLSLEFPGVVSTMTAEFPGADLQQFALGRDVIVAPILNDTASHVDVFLPSIDDGPWMHLERAGRPSVPVPSGSGSALGIWRRVYATTPGVGLIAPCFYRNGTSSAGLLKFVRWIENYRA